MREMRVAMLALVLLLAAAPAAHAESVVSLPGYRAPGTPAADNKVTVVKEGPGSARNVLVLAPGTQAGAGYLLPVARDMVARMPGWQVWAVDRRENLLEDHSALDGTASPQELFDYYLGWIGNQSIARHFTPADAPFARDWGMKVAVEDLRRVIREARKGGRTVVLGGHSLGATIAVAYASWDFNGRAGAKDLAGLVLIDGGSSAGSPPTPKDAQGQLDALKTGSPFLDLVGLNLPWATGVLAAVGSTLAIRAPDEPAQLAAWPLLPASLKPPVPVGNRAAFGYAIDASTGPQDLALVQAHIGRIAGGRWVNGGFGTVQRAAQALSGIRRIDGTAWYHPRRLSIDAGAVDGGVKNPAQRTLDVRATHGADLRLPIYALETRLGKGRVLKAARALARRSHAPELELVDRSAAYSHCDPLFALPNRNDFLKTVVPFLKRASAAAARAPRGD